MASTESLTPQQLAEYREAFNIFDADCDRRLTPAELVGAMHALGHNPTETIVQEILAEFDVNRTGTIEFNEFVAVMNRHDRDGAIEEDLSAAFRVFDQDSDGKISREDLIHILKDLGDPLRDKEIAELLERADAKKDGQIDYAAFIHLMMTF